MEAESPSLPAAFPSPASQLVHCTAPRGKMPAEAMLVSSYVE